MKRYQLFALLILATFALFSCSDDDDQQPKSGSIKVLLDTDMVEGFDDGVALMMMLASADVDVVGVTTVTGNSWAQEGVAYAIRQMEIMGAKSIPVISGAEQPLRNGRLATLNDEVSANPGTDSSWLGAASYEQVKAWKDFYLQHYGESPTLSATSADAADFIIQMLHTYPGQLSLLAIGPCTNIAKAIQKEPGIERLAKEIVYMSGSYFTDGNTTPYAEFNAIFDPEALAICLRAPFPRQTIVSLDVCNTMTMDKARYDDLCSRISDNKLLQIYHNCFHYYDFQADPSHQTCIWDVISAAVLLDETIITSLRNERVDVQDDPSLPEYGRTYVTDNTQRQSARILTSVRPDRIWNMINQSLITDGTHGPISR